MNKRKTKKKNVFFSDQLLNLKAKKHAALELFEFQVKLMIDSFLKSIGEFYSRLENRKIKKLFRY